MTFRDVWPANCLLSVKAFCCMSCLNQTGLGRIRFKKSIGFYVSDQAANTKSYRKHCECITILDPLEQVSKPCDCFSVLGRASTWAPHSGKARNHPFFETAFGYSIATPRTLGRCPKSIGGSNTFGDFSVLGLAGSWDVSEWLSSRPDSIFALSSCCLVWISSAKASISRKWIRFDFLWFLIRCCKSFMSQK